MTAPTSDLTRRQFLGALGAGGGLAVVSPLLGVRVAYGADAAWSGDTVVVVSLRGGFDGLSAVVPAGDPLYLPLRPGIGVPSGALLPLDATFGMHPALAPLKAVYDAGDLAVVNATGMSSPNLSHFESMDLMERAAPGSAARTGWLDRMLSLHDPSGPFGAVQVGSSSMPMAFAGPNEELGLTTLTSFRLAGSSSEADRTKAAAVLTAMYSAARPNDVSAVGTTLGALSTAAALTATPRTPGGGAVYPDGDVGRALFDVATLIVGGTGIRVATIDIGDWDMHADLGRVDGGWMAGKLEELGAALAAFRADLGAAMNNVTLLTISEFGRRVEENTSGGVDHGWGNVMFVMGGNVVGGLHGAWPGLADLDDGNLRATTDYRAVLADVLANRCGASATQLATVFPGWTGSPLGVTHP